MIRLLKTGGPDEKSHCGSDIKESLDARVLTKRGLGDEIAIGGYPVRSRKYVTTVWVMAGVIHFWPEFLVTACRTPRCR
jgi:hypothetical protein